MYVSHILHFHVTLKASKHALDCTIRSKIFRCTHAAVMVHVEAGGCGRCAKQVSLFQADAEVQLIVSTNRGGGGAQMDVRSVQKQLLQWNAGILKTTATLVGIEGSDERL